MGRSEFGFQWQIWIFNYLFMKKENGKGVFKNSIDEFINSIDELICILKWWEIRSFNIRKQPVDRMAMAQRAVAQFGVPIIRFCSPKE